jgi:thioredoxin-dependent peroxiredoxin
LQLFDVAYFAASCDKPESNRKFAEGLELDYPILSDPEAETARAYGVVQGILKMPKRWTFIIGEDGKILDIDKQVTTATHGRDLAAKLKQLGVAEKTG